MRRYAIPFIAVASAIAVVTWGGARAQVRDSFTLGEHDKVIAEASGCHAECRVIDPTRRVCTVDRQCRAVCQVLPECKTDTLTPLRVCVIMRDRP